MCIRASLPHIVEIDRPIFVERRRQGFFGRAYVGMALHREGNRMLEDVRLDEPVSYTHLDVYKRQILHFLFADYVSIDRMKDSG